MDKATISKYRSYQGGYFRTLISPAETGNMLALIEFTLPKGSEPPLHIHSGEDECFYLIAGKLSVKIENEITILDPGAAIFAPKNKAHAFSILTDEVKMINLITPGKLWQYFMDFSSPLDELPSSIAASAPDPMQLAHMLEVISKDYKVQFVA
ncbi:MAG: cupin domain-containing protein [Agriterribacter sp.]